MITEMEALWGLSIILVLIALHYLAKVLHDNLVAPYSVKEGFESVPGSEPGNNRWLDNSELYDEFYASVYDQLTQGSVRTQAEVGMLLHEWTKRGEDLKTFEILDAGCGTGIAVASFAKMNVKRVVGLDSSEAMINQAKTKTIPQTTLTPEQVAKIEWRKADLIDPSAGAGGEFTHALLLYFTIYYVPDKEIVFRNLFFSVRPGGRLAVHVVNKHKFDPMLESAAPWIGFSLQKYSDKRVTKSEVTFDKFKYSGEFDLQDPGAEFRETFRFNDKTVRRHRHIFRMENIEEIVEMAKRAGWNYKGFTDLTPISFEYSYHLHFTHP